MVMISFRMIYLDKFEQDLTSQQRWNNGNWIRGVISKCIAQLKFAAWWMIMSSLDTIFVVIWLSFDGI